MTQLLTSVKNVDEAMLALYAGVDLIDLKDPNNGALGALDVCTVAEIVNRVSTESQLSVLLSATVGEDYSSVDVLISNIKTYSALGVDIVKVAVSELVASQTFMDEIEQIAKAGTRLVAVFFAENAIDSKLIESFAKKGFYGAMLDTQQKHHSLLEVKTTKEIEGFVEFCEQHLLVSGLAGSVRIEEIERLVKCRSDYIGMRGGLCQQGDRTANLSRQRLKDVRQMLFQCNTHSSMVKKPLERCLQLDVGLSIVTK